MNTFVIVGGGMAGAKAAETLREEVVAAMNVNVWDVTDHLQALIRERRQVTAEQLRDPDVPLDRLGR
jgi:hypothetical protein